VVAEQAVVIEHLRDDLRGAEVLEDALVDTVFEVGEAWAQADLVMRQAFAPCSLGDAMDLSIDTRTRGAESEKGLLVQQVLQIEIALAHQLQIEAEGLVQGFATGEGGDLQWMLEVLDCQAEARLIGRRWHGFLLGKPFGVKSGPYETFANAEAAARQKV
jgi:hypothetical protein